MCGEAAAKTEPIPIGRSGFLATGAVAFGAGGEEVHPVKRAQNPVLEAGGLAGTMVALVVGVFVGRIGAEAATSHCLHEAFGCPLCSARTDA
jgi:hypothetical protein